MSSAISLAGVTKCYGNHTALDNVSYEVPQGVVFALLGKNGADKTTTIKLLLGLAVGCRCFWRRLCWHYSRQ